MSKAKGVGKGKGKGKLKPLHGPYTDRDKAEQAKGYMRGLVYISDEYGIAADDPEYWFKLATKALKHRPELRVGAGPRETAWDPIWEIALFDFVERYKTVDPDTGERRQKAHYKDAAFEYIADPMNADQFPWPTIGKRQLGKRYKRIEQRAAAGQLWQWFKKGGKQRHTAPYKPKRQAEADRLRKEMAKERRNA